MSTLGHLDLSWVNTRAILRRLEGYVVHFGAILGHPRAILGHPGAMLGGLEGDLGPRGPSLDVLMPSWSYLTQESVWT